jgi:hypothetical protein
MSGRLQVVIKLTDDQRSEIKKKLDKEVTHVKFWVVPGSVILAEAVNEPKALDGRS